MIMKSRSSEYSKIETYHVIKPADLNAADRLFGGTLMSWIDEVAVLVARKHSMHNVTTGSVNNLKFLRGAYLKDTVVLSGRVVYVGKTSMDIKVDTFVEHITGERDLINTAYLTLIALDENDKPVEVPGIELITEEDKQEYDYALRRRSPVCSIR